VRRSTFGAKGETATTMMMIHPGGLNLDVQENGLSLTNN